MVKNIYEPKILTYRKIYYTNKRNGGNEMEMIVNTIMLIISIVLITLFVRFFAKKITLNDYLTKISYPIAYIILLMSIVFIR
jgi:hypothetical protein